MVSVGLSLMANDVKHLLVYLFAIRISSLMKDLFRSLVHLVIMLVVSLLLSFESFFIKKYILDTNFSQMCSTRFEGYSVEKVPVSFPGEHDMDYINPCRKSTFVNSYFL